MLDIYSRFAEEFLAIPVIKGEKTESERFPGAVQTFSIEAMMQDRKALQMGTSHFLGQNFAKAFDVKFLSKDNNLEYVWATSWGVSTRLIGALIMTHSDDNGLVLPPTLAPTQVVIIPIYKNEEQLKAIDAKATEIMADLKQKGISVIYDNDDSKRSGWKFNEYELKGVPIRIAIGPRDLENAQAELMRRDTMEKENVSLEGISETIARKLDEIQKNIFDKALKFRSENTRKADSYEEFQQILDTQGGFVLAHWDGTSETEEKIKEETKATIRCILFDTPLEEGRCIYSGKPSQQRVVFARSY